MASLVSLQGNGGGRIPMGSFSYPVSRTQLAEIIGAMSSDTSHMLRDATRAGDTSTAQRLIREAAAAYFASTPPRRPLTRLRRATCTAALTTPVSTGYDSHD